MMKNRESFTFVSFLINSYAINNCIDEKDDTSWIGMCDSEEKDGIVNIVGILNIEKSRRSNKGKMMTAYEFHKSSLRFDL